MMAAFQRQEGEYRIECVLRDVNEICNKVKNVPLEWIIGEGSDLAPAFTDYVKPLVQGAVQLPLGEDGLPAFVKR
jgi:ATP-dependent phosphofructokinase / diphosphate-dependent phosphofructokinase